MLYFKYLHARTFRYYMHINRGIKYDMQYVIGIINFDQVMILVYPKHHIFIQEVVKGGGGSDRTIGSSNLSTKSNLVGS
jgi:hypothetical protein